MSRTKKKIHYVYKTTCLVTSRYYIGIHSTNNIDDGYLGSGKRLRYSIRKHGADNHTKEILEFSLNRESLILREQQIVTSELIKDPLCMNLRDGGTGGWSSDQQRENARRSNIKQKWLNQNDEEWRLSRSAKRSKALSDAYKEGRRSRKHFYDWTGKSHSDETKRKIGQKNSEKQSGVKNSSYGKRWMCHHIHEKNIKVEVTQISSLLANGWVFGRKMSYTR